MEPEATDKSLAEAEVYEPDCGKPKSQPDADLCVQRRVADAAESALHWTQFQTVGALAGLVLVLATLGVTAWTGKAASVAAQAAVDAVGTERAWMSFVDMMRGMGAGKIDDVEHEHLAIFAPIWVNAGRSSALKSGIQREFRIISFNGQIPHFVAK